MTAERVEVLRGPASALYGSNAMGGVVNIVTRKPVADGSLTSASIGAGSWGSFQSEASNQFRKGRFSSTVSAQYSRSDNHRSHMGFEQYGGFVKLGYDLSPHWQIYADADITHFNASNPGTVSAPMLEANQWITRGTASIGIENLYARTSGSLSMYDNFGLHLHLAPAPFGIPRRFRHETLWLSPKIRPRFFGLHPASQATHKVYPQALNHEGLSALPYSMKASFCLVVFALRH